MIVWSIIFEIAHTKPGASEEEIQHLIDQLRISVSEAEFASLRPLADSNLRIEDLVFPTQSRDLPKSYLNFLEWSNGGDFDNGGRWISFFTTSEVREFNIGYGVLLWMPGTVAFASNGGGELYLFDMRSDPIAGEYPLLMADANALFFRDSPTVARSL